MSGGKTDPEFFVYEGNIIDLIATGTNAVDWHIPPTQFAIVTGMKAIYDPMWVNTDPATTKKVRSSDATQQRSDYRIKTFEPALNKFVGAWVKNNSFIPNADKITMGVHIDDGSITHSVKPTTVPVKEGMDLSVSQHIKIDFIDSVSGKAAKPDGVLRLESWVFIQEPKIGTDGHVELDVLGNVIYTIPLVDEDYHHWGLDSSTMDVDLEFALADAGKGVYIRNRYANNVDHGNFSATIITVIPK